MKIRKGEASEIECLMDIYAYARSFMAEHGNPKQWGATNWPPRELILDDISKGNCYVCEEDGLPAAVFYYAKEEDRSYLNIEEGEWKDSYPYGVVHRIASSGNVKGVGSFCIRWAYEQCGHLRMDTHGDNVVMQNLLKKLGFEYCGIIHVTEDNDPRLAFEWLPVKE